MDSSNKTKICSFSKRLKWRFSSRKTPFCSKYIYIYKQSMSHFRWLLLVFVFTKLFNIIRLVFRGYWENIEGIVSNRTTVHSLFISLKPITIKFRYHNHHHHLWLNLLQGMKLRGPHKLDWIFKLDSLNYKISKAIRFDKIF